MRRRGFCNLLLAAVVRLLLLLLEWPQAWGVLGKLVQLVLAEAQ